MNKILIVSLICMIFIVSGCQSSIKNDNQEINIQNVSQCGTEYVNDLIKGKFGVDVSSGELTSCSYKFLGYGGAYSQNISMNDFDASIYYSGMGSGGHGHTVYCFATTDSLLIEDVQEELCENMKYVRKTNNLCNSGSDFDATSKVIELCNEGLFTYETEKGKVISYAQYESVCGKSIKFGTFDCVEEKIEVSDNQKALDDLIETFN